jgi:hypothetical protein
MKSPRSERPALLLITLGLPEILMGQAVYVDKEGEPRKTLKPKPSKVDDFGNRIQ